MNVAPYTILYPPGKGNLVLGSMHFYPGEYVMGMRRFGTYRKFEGRTGELNTGHGAKTALDAQLLVGR